jgi:tetratricopeptide (TPR) repeat protein
MNHLKEYYELLTNNIDLVKEMIISQNQLNKFAPLVQIAVNENRNKVIEIQKMHTKVLRSTKIEFRKAEELSYTVTKLIKATAVSRAKEIEKALKLGIESFNDALYLQSYSQLKKLFWLDMSHRELNFYLGRSAFELEDYDSAISAYERILILFPDDVRTRVEIARSYFKLKMYDQAKNAFEKVLLMPIPETVRKNILFYMSYIDQSRKHSFLSTSLSLGYLIDDNVKNGNEYVPEALKSVQGDTPINPKIADNAYLASLNLSYLYDMFDKDGFYLQSNSSFYAQKYSKKEAKEADVMFGSITAGVGYKYERFNISIPIGYEKLNYGGNDYFSSITIGLNTMIPRNSDDYYLVNVKHQIKKHVQASDASRDGVNDDVMLGYQFFMLNGSSSLTSAFTYTRERADDQTNKRSDIDYDSLKLSANLFSRLFGVLSINSHYAFRYLRYQDVSNTTFSQIDPKNENRTDIVHNFGLNFGYSFLKKSAINLSLSKVIASSLYHDLFKYDKQSISVMLEQRF